MKFSEVIKKYNLDLVSCLFILAVFSLVWRQGNIMIGIPKIFELLILLIIGLVLCRLVFSRNFPSIIKNFYLSLKPYIFLLTTLLILIFIGHLNSIFSYPAWNLYLLNTLVEYARIIFVFLFFFLTIYLVRENPDIKKPILGAVALSPLLLWLALVPAWESLFLDGGRLRGTANDPNYLASWIILGILISSVFFLWEKKRMKWLGLVNLFLIAPLLLWTGSRGAWLSAGLSGIFITFWYLYQNFSWNRGCNILIVGVAVFLSLILSFSILPQKSKMMILYRGVAPFLGATIMDEVINNFNRYPLITIAKNINVFQVQFNKDYFDFGQNRQDLLMAGSRLLIHSPLGLGPAYYNWSPVGIIDGRKQGSHNLWLEVGLSAGWAGLATWLVFLGFVGKNAWFLFKQDDFVDIILAVSLISILILSVFLDIFTLRWLWLLMAMIVAVSFSKKNSKK